MSNRESVFGTLDTGLSSAETLDILEDYGIPGLVAAEIVTVAATRGAWGSIADISVTCIDGTFSVLAARTLETVTEVTRPDGSRFVSRDSDLAAVLYRPAEGYSLRTITGHTVNPGEEH